MKNASQLSGASPSPVEDTTNTETAPGRRTAATSVSFMDAQDVAKEPFPKAAASADIALQMSAALPV